MTPTAEVVPSLLAIRRELEEIDRALVLLVAARVETASSAIRIRSERDGRLSDAAQEEVVLSRAKGWAEQAGVPSELVETIFRAMLTAGKERFAASRDAHPAAVRSAPARGTGRDRRIVAPRRSPNDSDRPESPVPT
ncbi:MAG: chorismate mutase [Thermoplasmata archaeon]|jgi:chorismate mutase